MSSYNRIIIVGNLGRDPETRYTPNGDPITSFSVATSERRKGANGEAAEETTWHNVQAFGRTAEVASEYLRKGSKCLVEGRYRSRKWTDKEGSERLSFEVICDRVVLLSPREAGASEPAATRAPAPTAVAASKPKPAGGIGDMDDDIPF